MVSRDLMIVSGTLRTLRALAKVGGGRAWRALMLACAGSALLAAEPSKAQRPSLVLITLDTTRADHLGCYGSRRAATPNLDALARGGTLFETALSPAPLTLPSHATMMTGLVPRHHEVRDNAVFRLAPTHPTLAFLLASRGYATGAVVGAAVLDRITGIGQGFGTFDDRVRIRSRSEFNYEERAATQVTDGALQSLKSLRPPFFLWVHYYDAHYPYVPPAPYEARFRDSPYDGEIAFIDAQIGRLVAAIDAKSARRATLIAVAGDHGESLGEHGEDRHDLFIYQATQRVPLILSGATVPQGRRIAEPCGLVDLMPTLLGLLGETPPPGLDGSPIPLLSRRGASSGKSPGPVSTSSSHPSSSSPSPPSPASPSYEMESFFPAFAYNWAPPVGLVRGRWKYVGTPRPELYDLASDPRELRNLLADTPAAAGGSLRPLPASSSADSEGWALGSHPPDLGPISSRTSFSVTSQDISKSKGPKRTPTTVRPPRLHPTSTAAIDARRIAASLAAELRARYDTDPVARGFDAPVCAPQLETGCATTARAAATNADPGKQPGALPAPSPGAGRPRAGTDAPPPGPSRTAEDAEQRERLAALGYVGGSVAPGEAPPAGPRRDPKDGASLVRDLDRARAALQSGRAAEAVHLLNGLAELDPRNRPVLDSLGAALLEAGRFDQAIEVARRTVALRPDDGLSHSNLAGAMRAKAASLDGAAPGIPGRGGGGDPAASALREQAAAEYERALSLSPRDSEALLGYGQLELERARPQAARDVLLRAETVEAGDPDLYELLGRVQAALGAPRAARDAFDEALRLDPRSGAAHEGLGHLDYVEGNMRAAEGHYARALELTPSASLAKTLGAIRLYDLSDRDGARRAFRRGLELEPRGPGADEIRALLAQIDREP